MDDAEVQTILGEEHGTEVQSGESNLDVVEEAGGSLHVVVPTRQVGEKLADRDVLTFGLSVITRFAAT